MGPSITLTMTGQIRPDRHRDLRAVLPRYAAAVRRQPGCLAFEYLLDAAECLGVTVVERWADPVAAMGHLASRRAQRFLGLMHGCLLDAPAMTTTVIREAAAAKSDVLASLG